MVSAGAVAERFLYEVRAYEMRAFRPGVDSLQLIRASRLLKQTVRLAVNGDRRRCGGGEGIGRRAIRSVVSISVLEHLEGARPYDGKRG